jgi:hypothetical protein
MKKANGLDRIGWDRKGSDWSGEVIGPDRKGMDRIGQDRNGLEWKGHRNGWDGRGMDWMGEERAPRRRKKG